MTEISTEGWLCPILWILNHLVLMEMGVGEGQRRCSVSETSICRVKGLSKGDLARTQTPANHQSSLCCSPLPRFLRVPTLQTLTLKDPGIQTEFEGKSGL